MRNVAIWTAIEQRPVAEDAEAMIATTVRCGSSVGPVTWYRRAEDGETHEEEREEEPHDDERLGGVLRRGLSEGSHTVGDGLDPRESGAPERIGLQEQEQGERAGRLRSFTDGQADPVAEPSTGRAPR